MTSAPSLPDWASFVPERAAADLERLVAEAEAAVSAVEDAPGCAYEDFIWALDDATRGLWRAWGGVRHMLSVANSAEWRKVEEDFTPRIVAFSLRVAQSRKLYEKAKKARAALDGKSADFPARSRILDDMIRNAELAGVALDGEKRERFNKIQDRLSRLSSDFSNEVIDATAAYKFEKDGKTWTIDDANYVEAMRECADREVRENLCRARATRAPGNAARIDEILALRRECAAILGFGSYARLSLATKCAPSVEAVFAKIDELDAATSSAAESERKELEAFAGDVPGGLEPWDVSFYSEKLREAKYSYSEEELKRHFPFEKVLAGLFRMVKFLFGADVREAAEKPSVWHPDVRFFEVFEDGKLSARFYLDPYVRPGLKQGGAWMNEFRNRSDRLGEIPLALMVLNVKAPEGGKDALMTMRDVETLFHEFGHALQCMLTKVGEEDAAGINLVEWDAVEVASQFMENWCLDSRTGIEIPPELKAKVEAAKNFRAATSCRRQLSFAKTDMILHGETPAENPDAVKREVFSHFGTPMVEGDAFLDSFGHIFAGGYAAGYYSYMWSEVMSADCYGAFEEAGLSDDAAVAAAGRRYRDTILALGGSRSALDVFRSFRGRDPEIDAFLRQKFGGRAPGA